MCFLAHILAARRGAVPQLRSRFVTPACRRSRPVLGGGSKLTVGLQHHKYFAEIAYFYGQRLDVLLANWLHAACLKFV
jgi:hypothetical protein